MIRNVCIHVSNEQPLMADLYEMPSSADAGLVCTNLRSMDGKRPVFIDATVSTFFFPYHVVRFIEIPEREMARYRAEGPGRDLSFRRVGGSSPEAGADLDGAWDDAGGEQGEPGSLLPVTVGGPDDEALEDPEAELEIDEGFLQRIRDI